MTGIQKIELHSCVTFELMVLLFTHTEGHTTDPGQKDLSSIGSPLAGGYGMIALYASFQLGDMCVRDDGQFNDRAPSLGNCQNITDIRIKWLSFLGGVHQSEQKLTTYAVAPNDGWWATPGFFTYHPWCDASTTREPIRLSAGGMLNQMYKGLCATLVKCVTKNMHGVWGTISWSSGDSPEGTEAGSDVSFRLSC